MDAKLESFEEAFRTGCSGCRRTCECGKEFWDNANDWDWEDGEVERLLKDKTATALDHSVGTIMFENMEFVSVCDCWHPRARLLINFIESHMGGIAEYFRIEKERLLAEAGKYPEIKIEPNG